MIKIGMMIGERYEILEKIGTGGMSDVYKAKDHKLNRFVAVKVLKQEFGENANFVSKFRVEAQAAAGLMHPNIVNVYDVGEENEIHYIVMELVEGITLKKYIEKKARLSVKEAISIAIQVAMGIEAAHNNGIIHRDIKPQNVIISKDGKVKVTDFGIAKAATSNTITSNVMGSVHYTSPEQARGGYSDEKSDVYSLGITLFEMLTGRVPFNGETTVAIAIKHIQEELPSPRDYVAEIPVSVEQIVFKCCQKSPDRRYQNMGEVIQDLKQSLLNPDSDFVKLSNPDEDASTRMISASDMEQIKRQTDQRDSMEESLRLRRDVRYHEEYDEDEEYNDGNYDEDEEYDEDYDPKMERVTTILAIVAGVLICCIIIFLVGKIFGAFNFGSKGTDGNSEDSQIENLEPVVMIAVAGMNVEEAKQQLTALGLNTEVEYIESEVYEEGIVISADISEGASVQPGTTVKLTASSGTTGKTVPETMGLSYAEALHKLETEGFKVNKTEVYSSEVQKDYVISQNPESGTKAPAGSVITLRVSLGEEDTKVRVPNVIGLTEMDATVSLTEAGLAVGTVTTEYSSQVEADLVCYQSYSVGSYVESGTLVDIKISQGAQPKTYRFNANILAPTVEEDPTYKSGISVKIVITGDGDTTPIFETETTSFPTAVNIYGIKSSTGVVTMTYTVTTEGTTSTNPDTGEEVVTPGTTELKTITRNVSFAEE